MANEEVDLPEDELPQFGTAGFDIGFMEMTFFDASLNTEQESLFLLPHVGHRNNCMMSRFISLILILYKTYHKTLPS